MLGPDIFTKALGNASNDILRVANVLDLYAELGSLERHRGGTGMSVVKLVVAQIMDDQYQPESPTIDAWMEYGPADREFIDYLHPLVILTMFHLRLRFRFTQVHRYGYAHSQHRCLGSQDAGEAEGLVQRHLLRSLQPGLCS